MKLSRLLTDLRKDMVYAVRALLNSRGFALVGILSLGMGSASLPSSSAS